MMNTFRRFVTGSQQAVVFPMVALIIALATLACTPPKQPEPVPGNNSSSSSTGNQEPARNPLHLPAPRQTQDRGQWQAVNVFLQACTAGDVNAFKQATTPYLQEEVELQYTDIASYMRNTASATEKGAPVLKSLFEFPGDEGEFVRVTMPDGRDLVYFMIPQAGDGPESTLRWHVDNVLTLQAITVPFSAPAIHMFCDAPGVALLIYYFGAIRAQHPTQERMAEVVQQTTLPFQDPASDLTLSMPERLMYLRQSATSAFIARARKVEGADNNVTKFLLMGEETMSQFYLPPEFPDPEPWRTHIDVDFPARSATSGFATTRLRGNVVRAHGVYKLDTLDERIAD